MMYNEPFEKEFISRTLALLKQYETYCSEEKYEDTLFLNLCVGLLIVPQQRYFEEFTLLNHSFINEEEWGASPQCIKKGHKDISNIVRRIRNSISHSRFEFINKDSTKITHIKVVDKRNENANDFSFVAEFTIKEFKDFVIRITEYALMNFVKKLNR